MALSELLLYTKECFKSLLEESKFQFTILNYTKIFIDAKKFLKFVEAMFSDANIKFSRNHVAYNGKNLFLSSIRIRDDTPVFEKIPVHPDLLDSDLNDG